MASQLASKIGVRIKEAREAKGLTQKQLGNLLPGIVGGDQVSKWERGEHRPHDDTLAELAKALDRDLSFFYVPTVPRSATPDLIRGTPAPADRVVEAKLDAILDLLLTMDPATAPEERMRAVMQGAAVRQAGTQADVAPAESDAAAR